ncbi:MULTISPECIES: type II toxin-antitoxin system RelE/ParE family toxin [Photorhabdus]|uniref:Type II toxin-antitoxin system RelE/ParE family toxin n=2 Tax=Photorhabdus TaxID=29487 RepID=A0ABX0ATI0_9GAMM|nr:MULTISPECIES: type II toxin-antitoxin system RelE/ParE family toxin [Photorhabdus]MCC8373696.1 type II toxin-antitoxin system RelE/ParE family toxin [Photorhabdus bodei]MCC8463740.1 type II toxin-antitoxin system RelE/ParE family toxin [Photorhabdus bodei]MCT8353968.1 type II toxin-antitoxin system RelE/ParE family toxin [Photorhabdus kayaii]MDB6368839.1 type II toxin-antitoxin system RelE/ParE family toxin [Photorhabdus bodei]MDB6371065.1 type II toxin-antitoxin system RelE/ParE family tox
MPSVIVTPAAMRDINRLIDFLHQRDTAAAKSAFNIISKHIQALESNVLAGRPTEIYPFFELIIPFGGTGYVLLYKELPRSNTRYIVALRHQREIKYKKH